MDVDGYQHKAFFDGNTELVAALTAMRADIELPLQKRVEILVGFLELAEGLLAASDTALEIADQCMRVTHNPIRKNITAFQNLLRDARANGKVGP